MKKITLKFVELLPFLSVFLILGFIAYWQFAQYSKIEQLELHLLSYQKQVDKLLLLQQTNLTSMKSPMQSKVEPQKESVINDKKVVDESFSLPLKQQLPAAISSAISPPEMKPLPTMPAIAMPIEEEEIQLAKETLSEDTTTEGIEAKPSNTDKHKPQENLSAAEIELALKRCNKHLRAYRLTSGNNGNAYDCYQAILQKNPENNQAILGITKIEKKYKQLIRKYINLNNTTKAQGYIAKLNKINPQNESIAILQKEINQSKKSKNVVDTTKQSAITTTTTTVKTIAKNKIPEQYIKITSGCFNKKINNKAKNICIENDFIMGKHEVTQKQWLDIMGNNPSRFKDCGINCPVENISWFDIQDFIRKLNKKTDKQYRLPTENEWAYAARAGSDSLFSFGQNANNLSEYGNFCDKKCPNSWRDNSQDDGSKLTSPVGSYKANAWGLHDMHGNVWEWVSNQSNGLHVYRGGSWGDNYLLCQSSSRGEAKPDLHVSGIGFRLVQLK